MGCERSSSRALRAAPRDAGTTAQLIMLRSGMVQEIGSKNNGQSHRVVYRLNGLTGKPCPPFGEIPAGQNGSRSEGDG